MAVVAAIIYPFTGSERSGSGAVDHERALIETAYPAAQT